MAIVITHSDEERKEQARTLATVFGLPNGDNIGEGWKLESMGRTGGAILTVDLVKVVDGATVNALLNGLPLDPDSLVS